MTQALIYDAVRTPRGKGRHGALHSVKPVTLAAGLLRAVAERNRLDTSAVDDVVLGVVSPVGEQGADLARTAVLAADWDIRPAGVQLNRFCASGLEAVNIAAAKVASGFEDLVVAGGVESMSRVPMGSDGGAWITDPQTSLATGFVPQGVSADLVATLEGFTRTDLDAFAVTSQAKAIEAQEKGYFARSLVPVTDQNGTLLLDQDEGAGIAQVSALAGIDVVLKDITAEAAEHGRTRIAEALGERHATALDRITPTGDDADLAGCDLVIEAVFEDRRLKNTVLAAAGTATLPDAVIASNTSTLPITGLADAVPDPERFIGLHFFSPVARMPLVEIIRGERTSDATLARAFDYVLQIKKTPIVVNDSRGFYTTRVFATYVTEGAALVAEGVHPALVENVAKKAGMAVGPLAVLDEVTLTLPLQVRDQAEPGALYADPAYQLLDTLARELGRTGKAAGAGFYDYPADGSPKTLWPGLAERWTKPDDAAVPEQDIHDRLLFIQALETVRILDQGVLTSAADANIGSVYGIGFAPWTGGTLQLINAYGPQAFVDRADHLADTYGERFRPPATLRGKADRGECF
ncbi:3-hydroxyacyl-CoA dehydrogenase NAD-binding domain-containing protein [Streptomyces avermitilis]